MISIVAALGRARVLGKDNQLLWHIPDDLKRFKQLTMGHPVVMGRKTFESILVSLGKPLPGRTNIVVSRQESRGRFSGEGGVVWADSISDAIEKGKEAPGGEEVFIGGGGEIYRQALPFVDKLYLTLIEDDKEGDSFFPEYEDVFKKVVSDEFREHEGLKYRWVDLER